jgi:hypothetical protein
MTEREQEIDPLDHVCRALERVVVAWVQCKADYTDDEECGDELWDAVDALTSANNALKLDRSIRPERAA